MALRTVSCDPGKRYCGIALFEDSLLVDAKLIRSKEEWPYCTKELAQKAKQFCNGPVDDLILEYPTVARSWGKADPNDLVALAFTLGALTTTLPATRVECIEPQRWKGTISPEIVFARIKSTLSEDEKKRMKHKNEHVLDAIGIGMWYCKRLHAGRT